MKMTICRGHFVVIFLKMLFTFGWNVKIDLLLLWKGENEWLGDSSKLQRAETDLFLYPYIVPGPKQMGFHLAGLMQC